MSDTSPTEDAHAPATLPQIHTSILRRLSSTHTAHSRLTPTLAAASVAAAAASGALDAVSSPAITSSPLGTPGLADDGPGRCEPAFASPLPSPVPQLTSPGVDVRMPTTPPTTPMPTPLAGGATASQTVHLPTFLRTLSATGLSLSDARVHEAVSVCMDHLAAGYEEMDLAVFRRSVAPNSLAFAGEVGDLFESAGSNESGAVATYIPQLAKVDRKQWGIGVCTIDGQRLALGDADVPFSIQSCTKPVTYCMALEAYGREKVHQHVGMEPSGRNFNELALDSSGRPHNPLINSGAIMCCSMVAPSKPLSQRFALVMQTWKRLLGGTDLDAALDLYFQICSMMASASMLSILAATLANAGVCPITNEVVFSPETVEHCLSIMLTCGMYDYSGEFAYRVGLPAKSGVGGGILLVVPGVMGICTWSPSLDVYGNSARGLEFCETFAARFRLHPFHRFADDSGANVERLGAQLIKSKAVSLSVHLASFLFAARDGAVRELQRLLALGFPVNATNYDSRSALHLAASEGHSHAVSFLVAQPGIELEPRDRWGRTPLDCARLAGHLDAMILLRAAGASDDGPPLASAGESDPQASFDILPGDDRPELSLDVDPMELYFHLPRRERAAHLAHVVDDDASGVVHLRSIVSLFKEMGVRASDLRLRTLMSHLALPSSKAPQSSPRTAVAAVGGAGPDEVEAVMVEVGLEFDDDAGGDLKPSISHASIAAEAPHSWVGHSSSIVTFSTLEAELLLQQARSTNKTYGGLERVDSLNDSSASMLLSTTTRSFPAASGLEAVEMTLDEFAKRCARLDEYHFAFLEATVQSRMAVPSWSSFSARMTEAFIKVSRIPALHRGASVASYIPLLAQQNAEAWGLGVCTVHGQRLAMGDLPPVSLQAVTAPISYCHAVDKYGEDAVHKVVDREPSGEAFNALLLNHRGVPHNPLVNAGHLAVLALILAEQSKGRGQASSPSEDAERFSYFEELWSHAAGNVAPTFNNAMYLSEQETADRNYSLAYMLRSKGLLENTPGSVRRTLDLYFQLSSLELTPDELAVVAGTLANGGVCPTTQERVFSADAVRACLSVMFSSGVFNSSGEFAYDIGVPVIASVSGLIMVVVPGVMGMVTFAPPLLENTFSMRGYAFLHNLVRQQFSLHAYATSHQLSNHDDAKAHAAEAVDVVKIDVTQLQSEREHEAVSAVLVAAALGDLRELRRLKALGVTFGCSDYDGRTALHLAACEGHDGVVEFLLDEGERPVFRDRWGHTAVDDARDVGGAVWFLLRPFEAMAESAPAHSEANTQMRYSRGAPKSGTSAAPAASLDSDSFANSPSDPDLAAGQSDIVVL
ncbi:glutaminase isoform [Thecamonas trahens ATCC 50062]|uniref:glutaminase n=1 Tax=Thecamonas trahens ATCC 50062 TaxID=461836 RepID=A0A0L0D376_THETB|nr:glutaminase isoform [Thecamonas trahens ATCC 50062]KNC46792.1 glutaminase isoform [Thecamonas trahens ATCC 50062]|eukprot:XP_013760067.1 glutaminase isoform [Thecamonas trahens ATCC 50062]